MRTRNIIGAVVAIIFSMANMAHAQEASLSKKQVQIATIASQTAKGELNVLKTTLAAALDNEMTVNEAKEVMVHSYAYCGFPKALRGLQTLVAVLDDRKAQGISDNYGREASQITALRQFWCSQRRDEKKQANLLNINRLALSFRIIFRNLIVYKSKSCEWPEQARTKFRNFA